VTDKFLLCVNSMHVMTVLGQFHCVCCISAGSCRCGHPQAIFACAILLPDDTGSSNMTGNTTSMRAGVPERPTHLVHRPGPPDRSKV
jgi:hypothetical protein